MVGDVPETVCIDIAEDYSAATPSSQANVWIDSMWLVALFVYSGVSLVVFKLVFCR